MEVQEPDPMTFADYDRLTPPDGEIYELYDGYLYAFATGTGAHGVLCSRLHLAIGNRVADEPCRAFAANTISVRRFDTTTNIIPDGLVTCEDVDLRKTYITAPKLVVEVLSPRSVRRDRIEKLDIYCKIPTVEEYLMVDSRKVWACVNRRTPTGAWLSTVYESLDDVADLFSVDLRLPLRELYRGIDPQPPKKKKKKKR